MSDCAICGVSVYVADGLEFEDGDLCYSCKDDLIDQLTQEIEQWKTWGIIEIAVRNPNVASYMEHWENRAVKAEARIGRFIKLLDAASHSLRSYQYGNSAVDLAKGIADSIDKELIL
jgi:hypothetical protein